MLDRWVEFFEDEYGNEFSLFNTIDSEGNITVTYTKDINSLFYGYTL